MTARPTDTSKDNATQDAGLTALDGPGAESAAITDALVLFGATGDLARKKLHPSLYRLAQRGRLVSGSWASLVSQPRR